MTTMSVPPHSAFTRVRHLLELIRFSHTVFALPFALLAALMAWKYRAGVGDNAGPGPWQWRELAGILLCMVFARSVAMAFNRVADRRLDAANPRTRGRHLPAGVLSLASVVTFTMLCAVGFVASGQHATFLAGEPLAAAAVGAGARLPLRLQLRQVVHLAGPLLARRGTHAGADLRLDRAGRF
jgi:4-hydroxybenzoate polyprenyltransferase